MQRSGSSMSRASRSTRFHQPGSFLSKNSAPLAARFRAIDEAALRVRFDLIASLRSPASAGVDARNRHKH